SNNRGGIDYDPDWVSFSGRLGSDWFRGEPYHLQGTMVGVANTSSGQINIATLNITSPMDVYGLNKQSDSTFVYSLLANTSASEETLLHEDMETNPGWTTGGSQNEWEWGIPTYSNGPPSAHSGSQCYGTDLSYKYNDDADCRVRTGYIDLTSASSATLEFYDWYALEGGEDYVRLQIYDGSWWHTIDSFTGSQQSWTHKSYDLSSYVGQNIRIQWRLESDWNIRYAGYYFDDVWVNATQSSMPNANFAIDATRGANRSIILGFDLNADEITHESRTNYLRNVLAWLAEGAGYTTEVWVNNDPPEGWLDNESHVDTIQAGINAVPPGGTVYVIGTDNQVYEENVVVDKSIDLIGIDNPTIRASGTNVVTVQADWARIDGFTIEGDTVQNGIYIEDATRCTIINCTISTNISKMGVYLDSAHNNTIRNNTIQDGLYGIYADYSLGNTIRYNDISSNDGGIYLYQTSLTTVRDNTIHNNGNFGGVYMESGRQNVIEWNTIENNSGNGIHLISSTNKNEIEYNTIRNNSNGIWLEISNSNILLNNTISNNSNDGVVCTDFSHSNTLRENTIYSNRYGVNLQNSSNNGIIYNTIEQNQRGMYFISSSNNVLQSNTICNNTGDGIRMASSSDNNIIASCTTQNNSYGIFIQSSRNNTIEESTISFNNADGIYVYYSLSGFSGENKIINNTIASNNGSGLYLFSSRGNIINENDIYLNGEDGIKLASSSDENSIANNTIWNNYYNIHLYGSNYNVLINNAINNSSVGIYLSNYASHNTIYGNIIEYNNASGVELQSSFNENNISNNTIRFNQAHGVLLTSSTNNIICENEIYLNTEDGLCLSSSDINLITNNFIWGNANGIHLLLSGGTGNTIMDNTVYSNTNHGVYLENSKSATSGNNEITENEIYSNGGDGIYLLSSKGNSISRNEIYENENGIHTNLSNDNTIDFNTIHNNNLDGLYLVSSNGNRINSNSIFFNEIGMYFYRSSQGDQYKIGGNMIWNNTIAISLNASDSNYFGYDTANEIWNNSYGIYMIGSSNNHFNYNRIHNNTCGFFITSSNNYFGSNIISNNSYGIHLSQANSIEISENKIDNNTIGIYINNSSTNNIITGNNFILNDPSQYGVYVEGALCKDNEIYLNNFINVTSISRSLGYDNGGGNSWYNLNSIEKRGNYWGNYNYISNHSSATMLPENNPWYWSIPYEIDGDASEEDIHPLIARD
ncbi:MAG TPA: hypothetical protein ENL42_06350, partial [Thermoplasmatales archaeon]|nr:hypothetical protein [Thermoplasmatales archaeon]